MSSMRQKQNEREKDIANFFIKYFITEHNIDKNSMIPLEEEMILINDAQNGDSKSFKKIINSYRWLINEMCLIYRNYYPEVDADKLTTRASASVKRSIISYKLNASYKFGIYVMEGIALSFGINTDLADPYRLIKE